MSYYDHALMTDRWSRLERVALRQHEWRMARQAEKAERRRAPRRIADALGSLRQRARRSIKGRRSLN